MFETYFGIEIEFSGITRREAAEIVAGTVGGRISGYSSYEICEVGGQGKQGRIWKVVYGSIVRACRKQD